MTKSLALFLMITGVVFAEAFIPPPTSLRVANNLHVLHGTRSIVERSEGPYKTNSYDDAFIRQTFERTSPSKVSSTHPSNNGKDSPEAVLDARAFPFSHVVNHDHIKQALILAATNPQLGNAGVLISGGHGTCKSVLARAAQNLLRQAPFVTVPLNVMEESLLGSVDIEASLETGQTCFSPGLLAKAHQGILYIDDLNLMEEDVANILMNALADGSVLVEREGLSACYPCKPQLVVATYNRDEGDIRESIVDRFAMSLSSDAKSMTVAQRVQVVENVESFHPGDVSTGASCDTKMQSKISSTSSKSAELTDQEIQESVLESRSSLPDVIIDSCQILYLCEEATRAGCEGQRAEIFATEIAKTTAALHGRDRVNAEDLQYGVLLAIAPRANIAYKAEEEGDDASSQEPDQQEPMASELQPIEPEQGLPPPPPPERSEEEDADDIDQPENMDDNAEDQAEADEKEEEVEIEIPAQFMFGADFDTSIDPRVLHFQNQLTRKGKGRKGSKVFSISRGRFVKAIFPKAEKRGRLAIGATLRAAAPHQRIRREAQTKQASKQSKERKRSNVLVTKDDFRIQRLSRKAGTLVVFLVDASGSMALNRMGAAKGAAMLLLKEAYKSRDKIALIAFHGSQAEVLVPPTKSMSMTKRRLESLPCGGGSPLAHALEMALRTGLNEIKVKRDVGRVILVLLSDGRANVPLGVSRGEVSVDDAAMVNGISTDRKMLKEEVVALAKQLSALPDFDLLCIDTEDKFIGTGIARDITKAALGSYHHLTGSADTRTVSHLVQQELKQ